MRSAPLPLRLLTLLTLVLLGSPIAGCASALTIGQNVIVLHEPESYHARQRMEIHEAIHQRQYEERGMLPMLLTYLASPSRRLALEAEAYAAELCYLRRMGDSRHEAWQEGFTIALRGYSLLGRVSREQAEAQLTLAYAGGAACERLLVRAGRGWILAAYPASAR